MDLVGIFVVLLVCSVALLGRSVVLVVRSVALLAFSVLLLGFSVVVLLGFSVTLFCCFSMILFTFSGFASIFFPLRLVRTEFCRALMSTAISVSFDDLLLKFEKNVSAFIN